MNFFRCRIFNISCNTKCMILFNLIKNANVLPIYDLRTSHYVVVIWVYYEFTVNLCECVYIRVVLLKTTKEYTYILNSYTYVFAFIKVYIYIHMISAAIYGNYR